MKPGISSQNHQSWPDLEKPRAQATTINAMPEKVFVIARSQLIGFPLRSISCAGAIGFPVSACDTFPRSVPHDLQNLPLSGFWPPHFGQNIKLFVAGCSLSTAYCFLCRFASKSITPAATDTFRESIFPYIGIFTKASQFSATSRCSPLPSPPRTSALGRVQSQSQYSISASVLVPITQTFRS